MGGKVLDYPGRAMYFAGESDGYKKGRAEGISVGIETGRAEGIDKANVRVATDMIHDHKPLDEIIKYSKLAKDVVMSIANSLKIDLA